MKETQVRGDEDIGRALEQVVVDSEREVRADHVELHQSGAAVYLRAPRGDASGRRSVYRV